MDDAKIFQASFGVLCGKLLGEGASRRVFRCDIDETLVVKVATCDRGMISNVNEHVLWGHVFATKYAKHFAPVQSMSADGLVLLMKRTRTLLHTDYPEKVPCFFTDLKYANYGMLDDNFVAHDYGNHLMLETGMTNRMKVAKWWDDSLPS